MRKIVFLICLLSSAFAMADEKWADFVTEANGYLNQKIENTKSEYKLGVHERFDWDQETSELVFSNNGIPAVRAKVQFVGSVSTKSNTWLWSWANSSILEKSKKEILAVQAYGKEHGFPALTTSKWEADEVDGWEMTSISAYLLKAKGAYRSSGKTSFTYMVITDINWVNDSIRAKYHTQ